MTDRTLRNIVYHHLEPKSADSGISLWFDYGFAGIVFLNIVFIILQTVPEIDTQYRMVFLGFEYFSISIFTLEYLLRVWTAPEARTKHPHQFPVLKYIFSGMGLIDLLAIIPFFLPLLIPVDLRFLKLVRLIRALKIFRYFNQLAIFEQVIRLKLQQLSIAFFFLGVVILISSILMYIIEHPYQPEIFASIPHTIWWSVITLSTIGYGDMVPISTLGKIIGSMIAIMGIAFLALPAGILASGFTEIVKKESVENRNHCPHCGKQIHP